MITSDNLASIVIVSLGTKPQLTHEKWLQNPQYTLLNKSEDTQKCVERSKCSDHSLGKARAVGLLLA